MKKKIKSTISVFLALVTILSCVLCVDFSAVAAQTDGDSAQVYLDDEEFELVSVGASEEATEPSQEATEPSQEATEPSTQPQPTTQPTTKPTTAPTTKPTTPPAPTVGNVKNVKKTSFESDKITLTWDKVSGATGYIVYYCNADKTSSYTKYGEVKSNTCTVKNLSHTTQYHFKVAAYITQNGKKYEGKATVKKTATQPGKLSGLGIVRSSNVIEFKWNRNSKATGYRIYRACSKTDAKYVLYKTIKGNSTTSFTDTNVESGRAYYYKVKAYRDLYDTTYNGASQELKTCCGLCAVGYTMTTQLSRVSLSWNKNKYATGYDIYYSTSKSGSYTKLGTTKNTFYNTKRLTNGKTYYFRVRPYKLNGKSNTKINGTYNTKSIKVTNKAYGESIGNTYIEISIKQQHMWFYVDGDLYCETDVVTGNDDGSHNTPKGAFKILNKKSPATLTGPGYSTRVSYWMAVTSYGVGIHDSTWRGSSEYGGTTYKGNGSHGCINTPYDKVKKIYNKAKTGTRVVIY